LRSLERGRRRLRRLLLVDRLPEVGGVLLRDQPRDRHVLVEIRIAEVARAVRIGALHRLGHQVHGVRGGEAHRREIVAFEQVQHLDQHDAARARRRHRDHLVAAVGAANRRPFLCRVVLQIFARDQAAVGQHLLFEQHRRLALVEAGRPFGRNPLERPCEIGLFQRLACFVRRAVLRELCDRRRVLLHPRQHVPERARESLGQHEAVARQRDCRIDQPLPRQLALFLPRHVQAGDGAGDADREVAVVVHFGTVGAALEEHRWRCLAWRHLAKVVGDRLAFHRPVDDEAAAADVAGGRVHDGEREGGGNHGVDRGAAGGDDVGADLRRDFALRRDHAALRAGRHGAGAGRD
jgi:hypothetical protein